MTLVITPFYASILALLYIALSIRVIRARFQRRISLGDNGDQAMLKPMRVHANFAEYTPLAIILIAFFELQGGTAWLIHGLGALFLIGRISHAYGVLSERAINPFRSGGMACTFFVLAVAALANLVLVFASGSFF
ncbi:glutathione metabolism protein [Roseibium denhamense]|uniref:Glutathione metabolism protein n=1 Tax=Roseibium denhamense TaxID=76305 RepID=A0ABY1P2V5_9HYPH|nr:MAPEG family protein [Roseibium denhamense]MTI07545.1 glutathione metabolism protein [Roseibium denhamense]SMP23810.1 hypothetical protein SAMN06265374_2306 [Roseibium denhamense]